MSTLIHPPTRPTPDKEPVLQDTPPVDPHVDSTLPDVPDTPDPRSISSPPMTSAPEDPSPRSVDGEQHNTEGETDDENDGIPSTWDASYTPAATSYHFTTRPSETLLKPTSYISRTLSMPLPSQLSQLENPHRPGAFTHHSSPSVTSSSSSSSSSSHVSEISKELGDSLQMAIQTMLQISPPQVLDPAKEHFSACSLAVPMSSMSAMFTAMKNLNYISAQMAGFCAQAGVQLPDKLSPERPSVAPHNDFDVGEMLQAVGDALSGVMAQSGVDLVLYHGDVGFKRVYAHGDESGVSFALSHVVRQVLKTTERGDIIEVGLFSNIPLSEGGETTPGPNPDNLDAEDTIHCMFRISHKFAFVDTPEQPLDTAPEEQRQPPEFSTLFLRRTLKSIQGTLTSDLPPPDSFSVGRSCELSLPLKRVTPPDPSPSDESDEMEPSFQRLASFGETLKGKRVTLYADPKGLFAHRLTTYLTTWGMDVTHIYPDGHTDGLADSSSSPAPVEPRTPFTSNLPTYFEHAPNPPPRDHNNNSNSPTFVVIDDDVDVLKERLHALKFELQPQASLLARRRPPLSSRSKSSPQVARLLGIPPPRSAPFGIMHFTSLGNYKLLKDIIQSIMTSYAGYPLPEVMIIPKPAGPRRVLTALFTAVTKPTVDPFFSPIATSPMSPGLQSMVSISTSPISEQPTAPAQSTTPQGTPPIATSSPGSKPSNRTIRSRSNSDKSPKAFDGDVPLPGTHPGSPLAKPDNVEYFSTVDDHGNLVFSPPVPSVPQSPAPKGVIFHAKSRTASRNPSSQAVDKAKKDPPLARRGSTPKINPAQPSVSFSSLHDSTSRVTPISEMRTIPVAAAATMLATVPPPTSSPLTSPSLIPMTPTASMSSLGPNPGVPNPATPKPAAEPVQAPAAAAASPAFPAPVPVAASASSSPSLPTPIPISARARRMSNENKKPTSPTSPSPSLSKRAGKRPAVSPAGPSEGTPAPASNRSKLFPKSSDANPVPPIKVLIVDDNPINQTILSTFMRKKQIKYDLANNGLEAVQKWMSGGFHLILMDIQMPIMDGVQATKEIRRLEKVNATAGYPPMTPSNEMESILSGSSGSSVTDASSYSATSPTSATSSSSATTATTRSLNSPYRSSVIIVALTASALQSDRESALAAGCNDFLTKPVSLLWLNNKIIEWGSIKALQMWADIRPPPDLVDSPGGQIQNAAAAARNVAERLHMPPGRQGRSGSGGGGGGGGSGSGQGRETPSPTRKLTIEENNAAAIALANSGSPPPGRGLGSNPLFGGVGGSSSGGGGGVIPGSSSTGFIARSPLSASTSPSRSNSVDGANLPADILDSNTLSRKKVDPSDSTDTLTPHAASSTQTQDERPQSDSVIPAPSRLPSIRDMPRSMSTPSSSTATSTSSATSPSTDAEQGLHLRPRSLRSCSLESFSPPEGSRNPSGSPSSPSFVDHP